MKKALINALCLFMVTACATSPTGRSQLKFFSESQMAEMGIASYRQIQSQQPISQNSKINAFVECVTLDLVRAVPPSHWEVTVFENSDPNAFALPGGKIGVNTGILRVAKSQSQLATVIGHEIAHVIAGHPNERMSTQFATQTTLELVAAIVGTATLQQQQIFALLGVGAQVGVLLPFSRRQESEADILGLDYMADAGFDPQQSIALWQNMAAFGGGAPPEFLSTHPSGKTRIRDLQEHMPEAMLRYEKVRQQGLEPNCPYPEL